jgi:hypothetical protein
MPIHSNRMWLNTFYISNIGVRVFLKWSKATATSYSHNLYLAGCWDLGSPLPKTVYTCQYYGFTSMKMLFYWLIILNNIILMIYNDQSTIIEAPEVYKSIPTHSPSRNQRQNVPGKNVAFDTFDVHVIVNFIDPNFQNIIFTLSSVSLITQKWFLDHLKNWHFLGNTPY